MSEEPTPTSTPTPAATPASALPAGSTPEERAAELERRLAELEASSTARLIHAELKAEAVRAGMVDLDGLKLIDTGELRLDAEGSLVGGAELMRQTRRAKPWLFAAASTSSTSTPPPKEPPRPKLATEMSEAEWRAARDELIKRA